MCVCVDGVRWPLLGEKFENCTTMNVRITTKEHVRRNTSILALSLTSTCPHTSLVAAATNEVYPVLLLQLLGHQLIFRSSPVKTRFLHSWSTKFVSLNITVYQRGELILVSFYLRDIICKIIFLYFYVVYLHLIHVHFFLLYFLLSIWCINILWTLCGYKSFRRQTGTIIYFIFVTLLKLLLCVQQFASRWTS